MQSRFSAPHLKYVFSLDNEDRSLAFAWSAQCSYSLRRRQKLRNICAKYRSLALWLDETGAIASHRAFRKWQWLIMAQRGFEPVIEGLKKRVLLTAMHRWFDYLPVREAAIRCRLVWNEVKKNVFFSHWKHLVDCRHRALKFALIGRARRCLDHVTVSKLIHRWRTNVKNIHQNRVTAALKLHCWWKGLVSYRSNTERRGSTNDVSESDLKFAKKNLDFTEKNESEESCVMDDTSCTSSVSSDESLSHDSFDGRQILKSTADTSSTNPESGEVVTKVTDDVKRDNGKLVLDVESLLKTFCISVDAELEVQADRVRQGIQNMPKTTGHTGKEGFGTQKPIQTIAVPDVIASNSGQITIAQGKENKSNLARVASAPMQFVPKWSIQQDNYPVGQIAAAVAREASIAAETQLLRDESTCVNNRSFLKLERGDLPQAKQDKYCFTSIQASYARRGTSKLRLLHSKMRQRRRAINFQKKLVQG